MSDTANPVIFHKKMRHERLVYPNEEITICGRSAGEHHDVDRIVQDDQTNKYKHFVIKQREDLDSLSRMYYHRIIMTKFTLIR